MLDHRTFRYSTIRTFRYSTVKERAAIERMRKQALNLRRGDKPKEEGPILLRGGATHYSYGEDRRGSTVKAAIGHSLIPMGEGPFSYLFESPISKLKL